jgi:hypothetical protein
MNYFEPANKDMLVVIPFFNPASSIRITQNLLFVYSKIIAAKIPVVLVHCIFPNDSVLLPESETYLPLRSDSYAFVKENITSIAIRKNLEKYNKYLMLDGDVLFSSPDWYTKLSNKLNEFEVVHPFQEICYLNASFILHRLSNPSVFHKKGPDSKQGFGMAFTKDFFLSVEHPTEQDACPFGALPEECLIGGGDVNLLRIIDSELQPPANDLYKPVVNKYKKRKVKYSYLENEKIFHLYHNELVNRQYISRHDILRKYTAGKTIFDIITRNKDGVYEWIPEIKEKINAEILQYFKNRNDDKI